jgi:hypothetical protein
MSLLSRSAAERILVRRVGRLMTAAGLDGVTNDGSNGDLNDPLLSGLIRLNLAVSGRVDALVDADLAPIDSANIAAFLDLAEYRALGNILGNLDVVDIQAGPLRESLGQLARQVTAKMQALAKTIEDSYGIGGGSLEGGTINMNFAAHGDDVAIGG